MQHPKPPRKLVWRLYDLHGLMRILVINPNSTEAVTRGIDEAVEPLRMAGGPAIDCVTLKEGPPGIETQQHVDGVVAPLLRLVRRRRKALRGVRDRLLQRSRACIRCAR